MMIPHERLRPILLAELGSGKEALLILPRRAGLPFAVVRDVLRHDGAAPLEVADALLCAVDAVHLWHLWPEDGGLADLWDALDEEPEVPAAGTLQLRLFEEVA